MIRLTAEQSHDLLVSLGRDREAREDEAIMLALEVGGTDGGRLEVSLVSLDYSGEPQYIWDGVGWGPL